MLVGVEAGEWVGVRVPLAVDDGDCVPVGVVEGELVLVSVDVVAAVTDTDGVIVGTEETVGRGVTSGLREVEAEADDELVADGVRVTAAVVVGEDVEVPVGHTIATALTSFTEPTAPAAEMGPPPVGTLAPYDVTYAELIMLDPPPPPAPPSVATEPPPPAP